MIGPRVEVEVANLVQRSRQLERSARGAMDGAQLCVETLALLASATDDASVEHDELAFEEWKLRAGLEAARQLGVETLVRCISQRRLLLQAQCVAILLGILEDRADELASSTDPSPEALQWELAHATALVRCAYERLTQAEVRS